MVIRILLAMILSGFLLCPAIADMSPPHLSLMPLPADVQFGDGSLLITQTFTVGIAGYKEARLERAGRRFMQNLSRRTGLSIELQFVDPAKAALVIHADHAPRAVR